MELDEFVAKLDPTKQKDSIKEIASLRGLYAATGEEFVQAAEAHQKTATSYMGQFSNKGDKLCEVIQIWSEAKKEVSLMPLVLSTAKDVCRGGNFLSTRAVWSSAASPHAFSAPGASAGTTDIAS